MPRISRRTLLQSGGAVGAAAALAAPAIAQSAPALKWRLATSWPKSLDTLYGGAERFAASWPTPPTASSRSRASRRRHPRFSGLEVTEAVSAGTVEACHTAPYYMWAKDPTFALAAPCRLASMAACRTRGGSRAAASADQRLLRQVQHLRAAGRQHHGADGRLVPQGDQHHRRPQGRQDAHRRLCRTSSPSWASPAAAPRRGNLPAFEKGTVDAAEWVGPYDDEKLGPAEGGQVLLLPRLVGRRRHDARPGQQGEVGCAARSTSRSWRLAAARPATSRSAAMTRKTRMALKRLLAAGTQLRPFSETPGCLLQGRQRGLCRHQRQERGLQEDLGLAQGLPRRSVSLAAAGRQHLRQLHDCAAAQAHALV